MATKNVDDASQAFIQKLVDGSQEDLNELKAFLFKENIRLETERRELIELQNKIFEDRQRLQKESDEVNNRIVVERKRLKEEQLFFDKKMEILTNGFASLEADRKAFNNARKQFEYEKSLFSTPAHNKYADDFAVNLFHGVNSLLSLKKRYKDLLKIFHPDNMGGDHELVLSINQVYEELKKNYEGSKII